MDGKENFGVETRCVLLFEGRTGSSMLGRLLNPTQEAGFLGEHLAPLKESGWEAQRSWMERLFFDTANFPDARLRPSNRVVGFKTKLRDVADPAGFKEFLETNRLRVVHMVRENMIKQTLSSVRAMDLFQSEGVYNLNLNQKDLLPDAYEIPLERFEQVLRWLQDHEDRLEEFIRELSLPVLRLRYEDLLENYERIIDDLSSFLDCPLTGIRGPQTIKITADDMRRAILNYEELKRFYQGTRYARFFD